LKDIKFKKVQQCGTLHVTLPKVGTRMGYSNYWSLEKESKVQRCISSGKKNNDMRKVVYVV